MKKNMIKISAPNLSIKTDEIEVAISSLLKYKEKMSAVTPSFWKSDISIPEYNLSPAKVESSVPKETNKKLVKNGKRKYRKKFAKVLWTEEEHNLLLENINEHPSVVVKKMTTVRHTEQAIRTRLSSMRVVDKERLPGDLYKKVKYLKARGLITERKPKML